ncbi:hypothetical protein HOY80DRAFT_1045726 [Tuber brumale]|nr:hypothetical protein HOY80DRAFT_1045726 [Tuber brumale]
MAPPSYAERFYSFPHHYPPHVPIAPSILKETLPKDEPIGIRFYYLLLSTHKPSASRSLCFESYSVIMPAVSRQTIEAMLSQVRKRDYGGDEEAGDGNGEGPVAIMGLIVAVLTLFVAIVSLRSSRFRRWVSHLLPLQFIKEAPAITPPNIDDEAGDITPPSLAHEAPNITPSSTCNRSSHTLREDSNTAPRSHDGIIRDGRAPHNQEWLEPRPPEQGSR